MVLAKCYAVPKDHLRRPDNEQGRRADSVVLLALKMESLLLQALDVLPRLDYVDHALEVALLHDLDVAGIE